jgi:cytoskeletal protein CcmA (bactofilin family)
MVEFDSMTLQNTSDLVDVIAPAAPLALTVLDNRSETLGRAGTELGDGVVIKGEVAAEEDLTIEGYFYGSVVAPEHALTIGPHAVVNASVVANQVRIFGTIVGTLRAREGIDIRQGATVEGHILSPRLALAEGAFFKGTVNTGRGEAATLIARYRQERDGEQGS